MQLFNTRFSQYCLTFLIATVAMFTEAISSASCQKSSSTTRDMSDKRVVQPCLKFRPILFSDGIRSSSHVYESCDGLRTVRSGEQYSTLLGANNRLQNELKDATKIIKRSPIFKGRRRVGERVVALFGSKGASIFWTYEEIFSSIEAPSLRHALAFERIYER